MRYAQITPFEVCNGKGAGVSLFVQGCRFQCKGCFNQDAWDFNGGKEWTEEIEEKLFELVDRPYIKRISILGGEPLADEHVDKVYDLILKIKDRFPDKTIWLYTGYNFENIINRSLIGTYAIYRRKIVSECDVVVDGKFIEELRDITLRFKGSKNQRVIDIKESLRQNEIVTI